MNLGTGLPNNSCEYVMLFNILQIGGKVGVIHWVYDAATPRGPSLEIRPTPEQCISWLSEAAFKTNGQIIEFHPYHYELDSVLTGTYNIDLRHTAVLLMLNHGIPVLIVSKRFGHSKPSITIDVYGHQIPSRQEEAVPLMNNLMFER
jgi:hypothetical protein